LGFIFVREARAERTRAEGSRWKCFAVDVNTLGFGGGEGLSYRTLFSFLLDSGWIWVWSKVYEV
jgi:hypothetical protein